MSPGIKPLRSLFALIIAIVILAGSSRALCGRPQPRLFCAEYFQEQVVVTAKLVHARYVVPKDEDKDEYDLYTMETAQVLRGRIPQRFRVIDAHNSGRTAVDWKQGESYLLFLLYSREDKAWVLDGCSNSGLLSESEKVLKEIHELQTQTGSDGTIQGNVWPDSTVTVLVRGIHRNFRTTIQTNQEGNFMVHVPAGLYAVWPIHKGTQYEVDFRSYENPRKIRIESGGCAQVQFNVREK